MCICMYVYTRFDIEIKVYKGKSNSKRVLFIKKSQQATNHTKHQKINIKKNNKIFI